MPQRGKRTSRARTARASRLSLLNEARLANESMLRATRLADECRAYVNAFWTDRNVDTFRFDEHGCLVIETSPRDYFGSRGLTMEPSDHNRVHRAHDTSRYPRLSGIAVSPDSTELVPSIRVNGQTMTLPEFRAMARAVSPHGESRADYRARLLGQAGDFGDTD